ncbi:MAG: NUDIX hydrolase [Actinomycetota bacterium]
MSQEVRAGGGVLRRRGPLGPVFAIVHRPRYDDWTFPKGKAEGDETAQENASREVLEETGSRCELGPELSTVRYTDHQGRPKTVRYWLMYPTGGTFVPGSEVDRLRWVSAQDARSMLTYEHDRSVLGAAAGFDRPIFLVRHAKAGDRDAWTEDDRLRPLSKKGRAQAEALAGAFDGEPVERVLSSPSVRCVQTVRPLALARRLPLEEREALHEGADTQAALSLLRALGASAVVCSHGDVIPEVMQALADRGVVVRDGLASKKGSTWVLERDGGLFTEARYRPPPV